MELISNFNMPPFARIQWASKKIKEKYEPLFKKARKFYGIMEKKSVEMGLRRVTTDHVYPDRFMQIQQENLKRGMYFLPLVRTGEYSGVSSYHPPVIPGRPWSYYGVLARDIKDAEAFAEAESGRETDHKTIGKLLGYPDCCIDDFIDTFSRKIFDPVWQRALKTDQKYIKKLDEENNIIVLKNIPWQLNTLLKPFTIGALFHSICSYSCEDSLKLANSWYELGKELNVEGLKEVEMFLRMPYQWDCYKGIAYITSPLFKISTNSNFTKERYIVQFEGSYYPEDGASGLKFPWDIGTKFATIAKNGNKLTYGG